MKKEYIIIAIPGIGSHENGFSKGFEKALRKQAIKSGLEFNFQIEEILPFHETGIDKLQKDLYKRTDDAHRISNKLNLRTFVLSAFGDAVTFESGSHKSESTYHCVHNYLRKRINQIQNKVNTKPNTELIIVTASLGVHILSTYLWDAQNDKGIFSNAPSTQKEKLFNVNHLFSLGCNIPLFISGIPEKDIKPIQPLNAKFTWSNYYDKDDILGWPLSSINSAYAKLVNDYQINTGIFVGSHLRYWEDKHVIKAIVKMLK